MHFLGRAVVKRVRNLKGKKCSKRTNITPLNFTLAPLWVLGEGVLCCIATALRDQSRREVVRSDKFVEQQFGNADTHA